MLKKKLLCVIALMISTMGPVVLFSHWAYAQTDQQTTPVPVTPTKINYLIMGGSKHVEHSQFTLERNVTIAQKLARQFHNAEIVTLFGLGSRGDYDVLFSRNHDPAAAVAIGYMFGRETIHDQTFPKIHWYYVRPNQLRHLDGSIDIDNILDTMDQFEDNQLENGSVGNESIKVYYNGHGMFLNNDPAQSVLAIGDKDDTLSVQEWTQQLDQLKPETHVQMVFTQCFAGGFTQINYTGGSKRNSISPHRRCAFCTTLDTRTSTGCSPNPEFLEEYSTYFFAAYDPKNNLIADFNHDGKIGADEAHAYTTANLQSSDIPIKTSEDLLINEITSLQVPPVVTWSDLLAAANPHERYILETLKQRLGFGVQKKSNSNVFDIGYQAQNALEKKIKEQESLTKSGHWFREIQPIMDTWIAPTTFQTIPYFFENKDIKKPRFYSDFSTDEKAKIQGYIRQHPHLSKLKSVVDQWENAEITNEKYHTEWALWTRLLHIMTVINLREALYQSKNEKIIEKYNQLIECEAQPFFANQNPTSN